MCPPSVKCETGTPSVFGLSIRNLQFVQICSSNILLDFRTCQVTPCLSLHMSVFRGGFFVQPHSLDFQFIFAESDLSLGYIDIDSFV